MKRYSALRLRLAALAATGCASQSQFLDGMHKEPLDEYLRPTPR